ncbi:MAG TPA: FkbM family methyltransferase [Rhizomicrobium sp.]|jgi:FkbM family methyltransferase|nr:FkbM family methyltransferase [Rhizomicrobium sp.]
MSVAGVARELVFDLGMHTAMDTNFYLQKTFRVVALEANPSLVEQAQAKFSQPIKDGQLTIVPRALWHDADKEISFFINPVKDDWSSAFKDWAEKGGHESQEISVTTTTLSQLFDRYGLPYYIKCDIEGADALFVRQLLADSRRPAFVSVEAISLDVLALLYAAGYDHFQIVNQALNPYVVPPTPPREGAFTAVNFTGHMSGLFGRELNPARWQSFQTVAQNYVDFIRLAKEDETLVHGWLDFHATTGAFAGSAP